MTEPAATVLEVDHLTKRYGQILALDDVTMSVPVGSIFGFLGPNGAGKTTLIRILMGFMKPTSGNARVLGHDAWSGGVQARERVGYLVTADGLYPDLSGYDQLDYAATISGRPPEWRQRILDALELDAIALRRRLNTYSKGMRQKLALTVAAQHRPDLLILDEPTDGLDPLIQRNFEELLRHFRDEGTTVFMSSHDLGEVERTCDQVAVVRAGKLISSGTMESLKQRYSQRVEVVFEGAVPEGLCEVAGVDMVHRDGQLAVMDLDHDINPLLAFLASHRVSRMEVRPPELQEVFMSFYEREVPAG
ncbi:MAG: ABC transporter ATP-binding protein [Chloroflexota bacterium]|nr:ABC transporter ATP-binding protein [Chloroflexota bacterium]